MKLRKPLAREQTEQVSQTALLADGRVEPLNDPLEWLNPKSDAFFDEADAIAHAIVDGDPIAQGMLAALIVWEVVEARRAGHIPSLANIKAALRTGGRRTAAR